MHDQAIICFTTPKELYGRPNTILLPWRTDIEGIPVFQTHCLISLLDSLPFSINFPNILYTLLFASQSHRLCPSFIINQPAFAEQAAVPSSGLHEKKQSVLIAGLAERGARSRLSRASVSSGAVGSVKTAVTFKHPSSWNSGPGPASYFILVLTIFMWV